MSARSPIPPTPPEPFRPCLTDVYFEEQKKAERWKPLAAVILCGIWLLVALAAGSRSDRAGPDDPTVLCSRC
jgi:hypothetical protein